MRKKISAALALVIIASAAVFITGCGNEDIKTSKALVEIYYSSFSDDEPDTIVNLFDETLTESLGGEEDAAIIFGSRISVLGEEVSYKITGTSYSSDSAGVTVIVEVDATYKRDGDTYEEIFQFEDTDSGIFITNISFDRERTLDTLPESFVNAYNEADEDTMLNLFSDAYYNTYGEDNLIEILENSTSFLGDIQSIELVSEYAYNKYISDDDVTLVQEAYYDVVCENGDAEIWIDLCEEGDEVKIYNIFFVPTYVMDIIEVHYAYMEIEDYTSAADMYSDDFFAEFTDGREAWEESLEVLAEYGEYQGYGVLYWESYEYETADGETEEGIIAAAWSQFGETLFYNEIVIPVDTSEYYIFRHYIDLY